MSNCAMPVATGPMRTAPMLARRKKLPRASTVVRNSTSHSSPAQRHRHARTLHGARVAVAMLTSILLTSGIDIPHGIWASVSMLVLIGGLQHQGNIRQKAYERAVGTAIGASIGLLWVAQYAVIGSSAVTYALLSITAGLCGYYAIGKGGYIALLTAITMCIVAGHGDDSIEIGLWRTANVLIGIGIGIALAFSFALPLHASYSWRYGTASNLRRCARLIDQVLAGPPLAADAQVSVFAELSGRLVALRAMMPSVLKESDIRRRDLEEIQRCHRALLSGIEMIASVPLGLSANESGARIQQAFGVQGDAIRRSLLQMARALRSRSSWSADSQSLGEEEALETRIVAIPVDLQGPYWLLAQIAAQCDALQ